MINLHALTNSLPILSRSNLLVTDLIMPDQHIHLINEFPMLNFSESTLNETHYAVSKGMTFKHEISTEILNNKTLPALAWTQRWKNFIYSLTSDEYIKVLSSITGVNLSDKMWLIEFTRYRSGDWLDAHYDKQANKVLTQLFYFNLYWDASWGGNLEILDPKNVHTTVHSILPIISYSVIIAANQDAWHRVSKVEDHAQQNRLAMTLQFYEDN